LYDFNVSGLILPDVKGCIQFVDISFSYPTRPRAQILRNVNLTINPGELVAVVSLKSS
jgi:ABC-type multidrug transport system fused ATPase/permease subunit